MSSARHTCNCDYCVTGRTAKKELQFGGTDWDTDDEELVPYRKHKGKNWRAKRKVCPKSKTDEACDSLGTKVKGSIRNEDGTGYKPRVIRVCSRCGKETGAYVSWWF